MEKGPIHEQYVQTPLIRTGEPPKPRKTISKKPVGVKVFESTHEAHQYEIAWLAEKTGAGINFTIKDEEGKKRKVSAHELRTAYEEGYEKRLTEWAKENHPELVGSPYLKSKAERMRPISDRTARRIASNKEKLQALREAILNYDKEVSVLLTNFPKVQKFLTSESWKAITGGKLTKEDIPVLLKQSLKEPEGLSGQAGEIEKEVGGGLGTEREKQDQTYQLAFKNACASQYGGLTEAQKRVLADRGINNVGDFIKKYEGEIVRELVGFSVLGESVDEFIAKISGQYLKKELGDFNAITKKWDKAIEGMRKGAEAKGGQLGAIENSLIKKYEEYKAKGDIEGIKRLERKNENLFKANVRALEADVVTHEALKGAKGSAELPGPRANVDKEFMDWFQGVFKKNGIWGSSINIINTKEQWEIFEALESAFWEIEDPKELKQLMVNLEGALKFLDMMISPQGVNVRFNPPWGAYIGQLKLGYISALKKRDFKAIDDIQKRCEALPKDYFEAKLKQYVDNHPQMAYKREFEIFVRNKFNSQKGVAFSAKDIDNWVTQSEFFDLSEDKKKSISFTEQAKIKREIGQMVTNFNRMIKEQVDAYMERELSGSDITQAQVREIRNELEGQIDALKQKSLAPIMREYEDLSNLEHAEALQTKTKKAIEEMKIDRFIDRFEFGRRVLEHYDKGLKIVEKYKPTDLSRQSEWRTVAKAYLLPEGYEGFKGLREKLKDPNLPVAELIKIYKFFDSKKLEALEEALKGIPEGLKIPTRKPSAPAPTVSQPTVQPATDPRTTFERNLLAEVAKNSAAFNVGNIGQVFHTTKRNLESLTASLLPDFQAAIKLAIASLSDEELKLLQSQESTERVKTEARFSESVRVAYHDLLVKKGMAESDFQYLWNTSMRPNLDAWTRNLKAK